MAVLGKKKKNQKQQPVLRNKGTMACPSPVLLILNLELLSNSMRGSRTCGIGAGFMILECDSKSSYSPEELMLHSKQEKKRLPSISVRKQKPIGSARHAASW